ncbi:hypothetical protein L2E82_29993 [Cichorium intybus]|uniref:Uncharacterized protein n=1 Tax=Cichorium intybus TaxID=13427 RepID=A0ACB9CZ26_CICIN|nr:hypothetical protein L2E82_29993 [Cichorium intybus]
MKAFLDEPWLIRDGKRTVKVLVPRVDVKPPPPQVTVTPNVVVADGSRDEMLSVQNKRAAMQKKAAAASLVAEDYANLLLSIFDHQEGVHKSCSTGFTQEFERDDFSLRMSRIKSFAPASFGNQLDCTVMSDVPVSCPYKLPVIYAIKEI